MLSFQSIPQVSFQHKHWSCLYLFFLTATNLNFNSIAPETSFFVVCTLNAINSTLYLPFQDGQMIPTNKSLYNESQPWKIWPPGSTTELTQMVFESTCTIFCLG